jgi:hypothetical protein
MPIDTCAVLFPVEPVAGIYVSILKAIYASKMLLVPEPIPLELQAKNMSNHNIL